MRISIAFKNGREYRFGFLKSVPNCIHDLLVKANQNMVKHKNKR